MLILQGDVKLVQLKYAALSDVHCARICMLTCCELQQQTAAWRLLTDGTFESGALEYFEDLLDALQKPQCFSQRSIQITSILALFEEVVTRHLIAIRERISADWRTIWHICTL